MTEDSKRQKCEVWTRCMGYHRPKTSYNEGKKSEFYSRTYFDQTKTENSKFAKDFA